MKDYIGDEDAGGAIMKKLYRIHSRYRIEIDEDMQVDTKQTFLPSIGKGSVKSTAISDIDTGVRQLETSSKNKFMDASSNIFSLFSSNNHVEDYEGLIAKEHYKMEGTNYHQQCEFVK